MEKYEKELREFESKRDKISLGGKLPKQIITHYDNNYSIGEMKLVNEVMHRAPIKPMPTILTTTYIECKVCRHKCYLDGSNMYGF